MAVRLSVYKFMAGLVSDTQEGGDSAFDPHEHRVIPHPTSYLDTMTHLLKASIGAGVLAMPAVVRHLGIIYSAILLASVCVFAAFCMHLLINTQYRLCKRHRRGYMAYPKSILFGVKNGPPSLRFSAKFLYWFVEITLIVWQMGICTIFVVFVAENVKQLFDYHGNVMSLRFLILLELPPLIIINLVKDLKMLSPLSSISNFITFVAMLLVFFYFIEDDLELTQDKFELKRWDEIPLFIGTALFALEAVGVVLALEYNMENPKEFGGMCGLFNIGMCIIFTLYISIGIFGYLKYGDKVKAAVTLNLPNDEKKAQVARTMYAVAVFLSFPLQNFVAYKMIWRRISVKYPEVSKFMDYLMRIVLVLVPWALAIAVPRLGPFISLFGALCISLLAIIFPSIMNLCVNYAEPTGYGILKHKLWRDFLILFIGTFILLSGVFTSIKEIVEVETDSH